MPFTVAEIAEKLEGQVLGDATLVLTGFAPADRAKAGDLTFAENETYFQKAEASAASAIMVAGTFTSTRKTLIRVANARIAFARVLPVFFPEPAFTPGIHPSAVVAASAKVDPTAFVGPHCVVGEEVHIGARTVLQGGNHVGNQSHIGDDSKLFPNVVIYHRTQIGSRVRIHSGAVIGADGFGYVMDQGIHRKVPQVGNVIIADDVEIGANTTIDRGALGPTVIGKGTKIDNLVQLGHNVSVGENCIIIAQAGIAGSTKLGNHVILGGQVGIAGHLKIGNHVTIGAQSGIMRDAEDGITLLGCPAVQEKLFKRQILALSRLPDLMRRFRTLEKKLGADAPATDET